MIEFVCALLLMLSILVPKDKITDARIAQDRLFGESFFDGIRTIEVKTSIFELTSPNPDSPNFRLVIE